MRRRTKLVVPVAAVVPILLASLPAHAATTTVALWHMDGTPMTDSSGLGNDGDLTDVNVVPGGVSGNAYEFASANSHVTVADSPSLDPGSSDFSYTVHVKFTVVPSKTVGDYDLIRKGLAGTSGGEWKMEILPNSTTGAANPFCLMKDDAGHTDSVRGGQNLATGTWHTITCVKTSTVDQLIVDGVTKSSTPATPLGTISNSAPVVIGQKWGGGDQYVGDLDEISVQTAAAGGGTAPTVTSTTPAAGATAVATSASVTATFSEPVQGVDGSTFTLTNSATGTAVPAGVTYDSSTTTATLKPTASLAGGTRFTASLSGAITDASGNALAPTSWSFTTAGDSTPPTLTAGTPADKATSIGLATNVTATFSEKVQGVGAASFTLAPTAGGAPVAAAYTSNSAGTKWTLNPSVNLTKDTWYTVTATGDITDIAGNPLSAAPVTWTFLTGPAPKVQTTSPAAGATGVAVGSTVSATFNEPVQNVTTSTFTLTSAAGSVPASVTRSGTTNKWILDPTTQLQPGTGYTATLIGGSGGITDLAGNPLTTVTWTFTTA